VTVVVAAAVNVTAVPTSAIAQGAPVNGIGTVVFASKPILAVVAVPAQVKAMLTVSLAVPVTSNCQTLMLCPADAATRLAEEPVPATARDKAGNALGAILGLGPEPFL